MIIKLTNAERDTILAALRQWQSFPAAREADLIATGGRKHRPLDNAEIERICKRMAKMERETGFSALDSSINQWRDYQGKGNEVWIVSGSAFDKAAGLKHQSGKNMLTSASVSLAQSLMRIAKGSGRLIAGGNFQTREKNRWGLLGQNPTSCREVTTSTKRLLALIPFGIAAAAIFASSDVVSDGVFYEDRAVPLLVIRQPKSAFLPKLRHLFLAIFFSYRPDALQFLLVDSAVPQSGSLELQLTTMCVGFTNCPVGCARCFEQSDEPGENFHRADA